MSHDAFTTFLPSPDQAWTDHPETAQQWYDTASPLAPLAMRSGLSLREADALAFSGQLTHDALTLMVALRETPRLHPTAP